MANTSSTVNALDFKVVVLGPASVGKTSIIHRYCNGVFQKDTLSTIGAGFFTHSLNIDNDEITLLLWDTAGEERFRSVAPSLLRGANGLILVFDLTSPQSFEDLNIYLEMFLDVVQVDLSCQLPILILGNKSDLGNQEVSDEVVEAWAQKNSIVLSYKVSAKTGENVKEAIDELVNLLLKPIQTNDRPLLQLMPVPATEKRSCC
ncbi:small GTP-binding protein [Tritrichomonas foetus]|uniref:Small GTP-binding protein n=1 Tax=Tritrichomonas foetus TaxID=1144522 RepID=A0A1J4JLB2_9EUKA|nr:small GTP-binding protein [Tritrichomonas foetus]|eukprot:OHS98341.1 small GTP-binding protein [Tritrichomonas foetus]